MTDEVTIDLSRADSNDNPALIGLARQGADSFGYKAELSIDRQLCGGTSRRTSGSDQITLHTATRIEWPRHRSPIAPTRQLGSPVLLPGIARKGATDG